jgi:alpha-beta hydrolase superfamily lysophospholipase
LFFEIEANGQKASRSIYKINIPMLVMHGSADPITSFRQTRDFVLNAGCLTRFKAWPGRLHELHNDTGEEEVFAYLLDWLGSHSAAVYE